MLPFLSFILLPLCVIILLLQVLYITPTDAQGLGVRYVDLLNRRRRQRSSSSSVPNISSSTPNNNDDDVQELFFTQQKLNHFSAAPEDHRTFAQRYFRSDRFVRQNTTTPAVRDIVFLCVGGEGPALDKSVLVDSVHCSGDMLESAQRLFATLKNISIVLVALEHRYYGQSYPHFSSSSSPVTNEHLVYLSSRQAVADLAHFVHTLFPTADRVVLFGGSYPGMLAAWARTQYPHVFHGAVSNSAPVQAVLRFSAYHAHVAQDLRTVGSPLCLDVVRRGHAALVQQLPTHPVEIAQQFHLCHPDTVLNDTGNRQLWLGDGVVDFGAQQDDPACTEVACNLERKCQILTERYQQSMDINDNRTAEDAAIEALAHLAQLQLSPEDDCVLVDWNATVRFITDPVRGQAEGLRSWLWQTCTEFGFYQTCDSASCPYGVGEHPLSQDWTLCREAFDQRDVAAAVQATNEWSGGWQAPTARILSVQGTVDPWSELARGDAYVVPGASHHFWTHPVRDTDAEPVRRAREYIHQTVHAWIL